jgi:nitroreductase
METWLAITSRRDGRRYSDAPIPAEVIGRILDAGRLAGSARNHQPWEFVLVESEAARGGTAGAVYRSELITGAAVVIAVVAHPSGNLIDFDAGRAAQNMMLAAWDSGVDCCPNGIAAPESLARALNIPPDAKPLVVLSFGYPATPHMPEKRPPEEWSRRARRRPLSEVARRV